MDKILIVEDKDSMARMLKESLETEGYSVKIASDGKKGIEKLAGGDYDLLLTDLNLPGADGLSVLAASKNTYPLKPVIVMTAFGSIETAVDAMKKGAFDFITKPFDVDHLLMLIGRALENKRIMTENILMKDELEKRPGMPEIIGNSKAIKEALSILKRVAPSKTTVLLEGESGTGKELFARALHVMSDRSSKPFVTINCAAIPKDLLESELFGHEKGSFTGAEARKLGKFEIASGGTVFLDEIGELDLNLQAKLLRALQEEEIDRVGASKPLKVDVRVVAASNRVLQEAVDAGDFRTDLFYRINVFPVKIPTLSERLEDINLLAEFFISKHAAKLKTSSRTISTEAMAAMKAYKWKGNIRELENMIERALILSDGDTIEPVHLRLPSDAASHKKTDDKPQTLERVSKSAAREAEERMIRSALETTSGNKTRAAEILGVSYKTLLTKIKDYEIN